MNLEKAKEVLKRYIENVKDDYIISDYCENCGNIQAIDTVLQALEEKEILYIKTLAKDLNETIKNKEKNKEDLDLLNEGWKIREKELLNIIKLMAEKINQAYFEENDFYTWFEEEFGIIPKGHYNEKIINYFIKLIKEK